MLDSFGEIELLKQLANGSTIAFDALYRKYQQTIYANIYKIIKQQEMAEEMLQDVFVALWNNRSKINSQQTIAGWLIVVSYNKSINFLNERVKEKLLFQGEIPTEIPDVMEVEHSIIEKQISIINDAIQKLPLRKREVFTLCRLEGKTIAETAHVLGISVNTVKEHLQFATKFVKEHTLSNYAASTFFMCVIAALLQ